MASVRLTIDNDNNALYKGKKYQVKTVKSKCHVTMQVIEVDYR